MKPTHHLLAGALTLAALLPMGCKSDSSAATAEAGDPAHDPLQGAVDAALRDLSAKLSARSAAGWPEHVQLSSSSPPRPVLRIASIINRTSFHLDVKDLERRVTQMLVEGGQVTVAAGREQREEVMEEREYEEAMGDGGDMGTEDAVGLALTGELEDDVAEVDGERVHKVILRLVITDTRKQKSLVIAQGEATGVSER